MKKKKRKRRAKTFRKEVHREASAQLGLKTQMSEDQREKRQNEQINKQSSE